MAYGVGIDTGRTYTDAAVFDYETGAVLAKGKSPNTRQDLSLGIGRALDMLPRELLPKAEVAALSTTLGTNACGLRSSRAFLTGNHSDPAASVMGSRT